MELEGIGGGGDVGNNLKKFLYKGKKRWIMKKKISELKINGVIWFWRNWEYFVVKIV